MGVYIKGMDMPKNCAECRFCYTENFVTWCTITETEDIYYDSIPKCCPLTDIPRYSRLVDKDVLMDLFARFEFSSDMGDAMEILDNMPSVIESEEINE